MLLFLLLPCEHLVKFVQLSGSGETRVRLLEYLVEYGLFLFKLLSHHLMLMMCLRIDAGSRREHGTRRECTLVIVDVTSSVLTALAMQVTSLILFVIFLSV